MPTVEELAQAMALLKKIDTPEVATALNGADRQAYLNALDAVYGDRMKRATDMGFGKKNWYHGTSADFDSFDPSLLRTNATGPSGNLGFHFADNPELANQYAKTANPAEYRRSWQEANDSMEAYVDLKREMVRKYGVKSDELQNVVSKDDAALLAKAKNNYDVKQSHYLGLDEKYKQLPDSAFEEMGNQVIPVRLKTKSMVGQDLGGGSISYDEAAQGQMFKDEGKYSGVVYKNARDSLAHERGDVVSNVAVPFDAKDIRSPNAAFDPRFANSAKIMAGVGLAKPDLTTSPLDYLKKGFDVYEAGKDKLTGALADQMAPQSQYVPADVQERTRNAIQTMAGMGLDPLNAVPGAAGAGVGLIQLMSQGKGKSVNGSP